MYRLRNDKDKTCVAREEGLCFTVIGKLFIHFLTECTNYAKLREQLLQKASIIYPEIPHQTNEGKHFERDLLHAEYTLKLMNSLLFCCLLKIL